MFIFRWISRLVGIFIGSTPNVYRCEQIALLNILAVSVRHGLSIQPMLDALQEETIGCQRGRIRRLASWIGRSNCLADALQMVPGVVSHEHQLAIRFGDQTGRLRDVLDDAIRRERERIPPEDGPRSSTAAYLAALAVIFSAIVSFIGIKIVPTFRQIYVEFGLELPWLTQQVVATWDSVHFLGAFLPFLIMVLLLWRTGWLDSSWDHGWLSWWRHLFLGRSNADVLENLAIAVESRIELPAALSILARHHPVRAVRSRLLYVRNEVEQGEDIWATLRQAKFIDDPETQILEASRQTGNPAWALRHLAASQDSRIRYRTRQIEELIRPLALLGAGIFVGLIVVAFFLPLTELIDSMA